MKHFPHPQDDPTGIASGVRRLPRPTATPEFRMALRAAFVNRSIPSRRFPPLLRLRHGSGATLIRTLGAAAAALIAILWLNQGTAWKVHGVSGTGTIRVNERLIDLGSAADVERALRPGVRIELPASAQVDLELPGIAHLQIVGGSRLVLPGSPGRWFGKQIVGTLDTGELRVTTGPRFHGTRLRIETPETRAVVMGTTLAVFRLPEGSCVCVLEGVVSMREQGSPAHSVRAGFRRVVYRDGRAPLVEPILPMETMKLEMLRDRFRGDTPG